jgi:hypothetical protein
MLNLITLIFFNLLLIGPVFFPYNMNLPSWEAPWVLKMGTTGKRLLRPRLRVIVPSIQTTLV